LKINAVFCGKFLDEFSRKSVISVIDVILHNQVDLCQIQSK